MEEIDIPVPEVPYCEPWNKTIELSREKDVVGFYISGHPLDQYKFEIDNFCRNRLLGHAGTAAGGRVVDRAVPVARMRPDVVRLERPRVAERAARERVAEHSRKHRRIEGKDGRAPHRREAFPDASRSLSASVMPARDFRVHMS